MKGILAPSGTPIDNALFVTPAIDALHTEESDGRTPHAEVAP